MAIAGQIAEAILSFIFIGLLAYTLYKLLALIKDTISRQRSGAKKIWIFFLWFIFFAPFVALVYMITTRDIEEDQRIKQRAWELSTHKAHQTKGP